MCIVTERIGFGVGCFWENSVVDLIFDGWDSLVIREIFDFQTNLKIAPVASAINRNDPLIGRHLECILYFDIWTDQTDVLKTGDTLSDLGINSQRKIIVLWFADKVSTFGLRVYESFLGQLRQSTAYSFPGSGKLPAELVL